MFESENKSCSISAISFAKKNISNECVTAEKTGKNKFYKKHNQDKYQNLRSCFGFFNFLETSWKTFKEFSADTSIHGK